MHAPCELLAQRRLAVLRVEDEDRPPVVIDRSPHHLGREVDRRPEAPRHNG